MTTNDAERSEVNYARAQRVQITPNGVRQITHERSEANYAERSEANYADRRECKLRSNEVRTNDARAQRVHITDHRKTKTCEPSSSYFKKSSSRFSGTASCCPSFSPCRSSSCSYWPTPPPTTSKTSTPGSSISTGRPFRANSPASSRAHRFTPSSAIPPTSMPANRPWTRAVPTSS